MNLTLLLFCCFVTPIVADAPAESIAVVDLRECLKHVPTADADRAMMMSMITATDRAARKPFEALRESERSVSLENSTDKQKVDARLLKLEFEANRRREQDRLRKAEQDMFTKWRTQIDIAVKTVAQRDGFTVVLYIGEGHDTEVPVTELQPMISRTHVGFVLDQNRANITQQIVAEMSTEAFVDSIQQKNK